MRGTSDHARRMENNRTLNNFNDFIWHLESMLTFNLDLLARVESLESMYDNSLCLGLAATK